MGLLWFCVGAFRKRETKRGFLTGKPRLKTSIKTLNLLGYLWYKNSSRRVKCYFSPYGLGHFSSLVQRFHFSHVGPKWFHRCHFSPLG
ncbi:hypothetical protein HanPSC8_Chr10g0432031 [Helianthus annuus]|nr:hypothetical protein HanPSC8_Chr10g0432031 [Helianthus annuus]